MLRNTGGKWSRPISVKIRPVIMTDFFSKIASFWGKNAFFQKNTRWGNATLNFCRLLSGPSWPFLGCTKRGPDNNLYLAQIITNKNGFFLPFLARQNVLKYFFTVSFELQPNFAQKWAPKTITFHICKTQVIKKTFCCNPELHQKIVFSNSAFLKDKH